MYFIVPLWLAAGVADWIMHRRAGIEHNSGPRESMIHLLMLAEMGLPVLAGLFLQVNALVLLLMVAAFFVHEATAMWDVSYAVTRRVVTPLEQHIHSFLEMLPLMAVSMMVLLHWNQFAALFGAGAEAADFSLRWKESPLPRHYVLWLMGAIVVFELLPYAEEFLRTLRGTSRSGVSSANRTRAQP
ncbi:diguanylate cyclase [Duganella callida]|uniref:Diguanylate cyclase n=2 Tax=Duganella callida TaxID=2561932 RepID=A0A4Y9SDF3_9BURK|nr:diguanylate cyclase [Duganella callida]